jgi:predicted Zn-dependent protease with MMP-like domain
MSFEGNIDAPFNHLVNLAEAELHQTMASLPEELREALCDLPVIFEDVPSEELLADGIEEDQLGMFDGGMIGDHGVPMAPRVVLWLGNIWDMCEARETAFVEEVRVTLLHEFGHFLGWDEADLEQRGLD